MADKVTTQTEMSPLGERITALFEWFRRNMANESDEAIQLLPKIFDTPQEDLDKELDALVKNGFLKWAPDTKTH